MSLIHKSLKQLQGRKALPKGAQRPPKGAVGRGRSRVLLFLLALFLGCGVLVAGAALYLRTTLDTVLPMADNAPSAEKVLARNDRTDKQPVPSQQAKAAGQEPFPAEEAAPEGLDAPAAESAQEVRGPKESLEYPYPEQAVREDVRKETPATSSSGEQEPGAVPLPTATAEPSREIASRLGVSPTPSQEERTEEAYVSKVRRNQRVMELERALRDSWQAKDMLSFELSLKTLESLLGPASPLVLKWQGSRAMADKHFAEAEALFRRALAKSPKDTSAKANLILSLLGQNKREMARTELKRALTAHAGDPSLTRLGEILAGEKRPRME